MNKENEKKTFKAGTAPGIGQYKCMVCGLIIPLNNEDEILPTCPKCGSKVFIRVK